MTYYVKTPGMCVSILSDRVAKLFAVCPEADDNVIFYVLLLVTGCKIKLLKQFKFTNHITLTLDKHTEASW